VLQGEAAAAAAAAPRYPQLPGACMHKNNLLEAPSGAEADIGWRNFVRLLLGEEADGFNALGQIAASTPWEAQPCLPAGWQARLVDEPHAP
jgi:hypothetical protein